MSEHFNTRQTLIAKIKDQHDEHSWEEFVSYYKPYIMVVVQNMGVKSADLEDVVQKILLVIWKNLPSFKYDPQKCKFRTWMNQITYNCTRNAQRSDSSYEKRNLKMALDNEVNSTIEPDVNDLMEREWKRHMTQLALDNIRPSVSEVSMKCFELFYQGKAVGEICETLDIKRNSAYVLRKRILERVRIEILRLNEELS